jgi:hypothetical protein
MKFTIDDEFETMLNKIAVQDLARESQLGQPGKLFVPRMSIAGAAPYRVEYPYGRPGDGFRSHAKDYNATCVAYHRKVNPAELKSVVEYGNAFRYGPGSERYEEIKASMQKDGFIGGDGQQIIVHVDRQRTWFGEGNHRMRIALEVGVEAVEVQIRYLQSVDEAYHVIPFDNESGRFRVDD